MKRENSNALFAAFNIVFTTIIGIILLGVFSFKVVRYTGFDEPAMLVMILGALSMAILLTAFSISGITTFSYRLVKGILSLIFKTRFKIFNKIVTTIPAIIVAFLLFIIVCIGIALLFFAL